jgi:hypothetical protein
MSPTMAKWHDRRKRLGLLRVTKRVPPTLRGNVMFLVYPRMSPYVGPRGCCTVR